jgi:hypothetical protein
MDGSSWDLTATLGECEHEQETCPFRSFQPKSECPAVTYRVITAMVGSGRELGGVSSKPNCRACMRSFTSTQGCCMTTHEFPHPSLHTYIDDTLVYVAKESRLNGQTPFRPRQDLGSQFAPPFHQLLMAPMDSALSE